MNVIEVYFQGKYVIYFVKYDFFEGGRGYYLFYNRFKLGLFWENQGYGVILFMMVAVAGYYFLEFSVWNFLFIKLIYNKVLFNM